jgi:homoserine dehydrogenase
MASVDLNSRPQPSAATAKETMIDVPVALLGYGTVGSSVARLLRENAEDIERATGHRLRVVRALVRDPDKERGFAADPGVLTTNFSEIRDDPSIAVVAEVMGGLEPTGEYVLDLLAAGKPVVSANKQLVARRGAELFGAASAAGVQLRFEASVCAAIPVIKVLREALVVTTVHRILGIVNGTTNFILTEMEKGSGYEDALAEAQRQGYAEADPTEDVSGADAAAKMAILATVAFGSRVTLADVEYEGIEGITPLHVAAAREMGMAIRLVGAATLVDGKLDVRVHPALVDRHHPLAAVEGPFNAVMLQGDAIREITLEGPGAGGIETASAVVADMVSVIGTTGTGFLQNDACWRELERLEAGKLRSPFYVRIDVEDRAGVLAHVALRLATHGVSIGRLVQHQVNGSATLHIVTHEAPAGELEAALEEIDGLEESRATPSALPVISDRGVPGLGWA